METSSYHYFTYVYQTLWSDDVQFLRNGARQTDGWMDGWTEKVKYIEVGAPPKTITTKPFKAISCFLTFLISISWEFNQLSLYLVNFNISSNKYNNPSSNLHQHYCSQSGLLTCKLGQCLELEKYFLVQNKKSIASM